MGSSLKDAKRFLSHTSRHTYANPVKAFLNQQFPGKWIGRGGPYRVASQVTRFDPFRFISVGVHKGLGVPNKDAKCG
jgi:hypothetical protein